MFDQIKHVFVLNHFLLSTDPNDAKGEKLEKEGLYGITTMDMLLKKMID